MKEKNSLIEGSIWKGLLAFVFPIFLGQVFQQLYNTADAWVVGKFLDKNAYAAAPPAVWCFCWSASLAAFPSVPVW